MFLGSHFELLRTYLYKYHRNIFLNLKARVKFHLIPHQWQEAGFTAMIPTLPISYHITAVQARPRSFLFADHAATLQAIVYQRMLWRLAVTVVTTWKQHWSFNISMDWQDLKLAVGHHWKREACDRIQWKMSEEACAKRTLI